MEMTPYLTFDGNCTEALNFYAEVFGGEAVITMTVRQSPMADQFPAEQQDKVMHGTVSIGSRALMGSDSLMAPFVAPTGFNIQVAFDDVDKAKRVFDRLARFGEISMAFEPTFFAPGFGICRDRFGMPWMIACMG